LVEIDKLHQFHYDMRFLKLVELMALLRELPVPTTSPT
jgi:hypothetical protein